VIEFFVFDRCLHLGVIEFSDLCFFVGCWRSAVRGLPRWVFVRFQSELGVSIRFRGASLGFRGVSILNSGVTGVSICAFFYLGRLCEVARAFAPPLVLSALCSALSLSLSLCVCVCWVLRTRGALCHITGIPLVAV
jgi:hypothetical protein